MTGIKISFLYTCHTPSHKSKEDKSLIFCCLGCSVIVLKFVEGHLSKGSTTTVIIHLFMLYLIFSFRNPGHWCLLSYWQLSPLSLYHLWDQELWRIHFYSVHSASSPQMRQRKKVVLAQMSITSSGRLSIYCSCVANSEDLVFEGAWIQSRFSIMLPWIFLQAEEHCYGEARSVQSLGIWEKVQVDLKPLLSSVKGFLQWRFRTCTVLVNEQTCYCQLLSECCSVR